MIGISVILCDTSIDIYEDQLSKIQFRLAKVLLEMLHGDMLLDVGMGFPCSHEVLFLIRSPSKSFEVRESRKKLLDELKTPIGPV